MQQRRRAQLAGLRADRRRRRSSICCVAQMLRKCASRLIVITPKSLLRHKDAVSSSTDLAKGSFQTVIPRSKVRDAEGRARVVVCAGQDLLRPAGHPRAAKRSPTSRSCGRAALSVRRPADWDRRRSSQRQGGRLVPGRAAQPGAPGTGIASRQHLEGSKRQALVCSPGRRPAEESRPPSAIRDAFAIVTSRRRNRSPRALTRPSAVRPRGTEARPDREEPC